MYGVRFKGLKESVQATRNIGLLQVIVLACRPDVAHQASNLPEFLVHSIPPFLVQRRLLLMCS